MATVTMKPHLRYIFAPNDMVGLLELEKEVSIPYDEDKIHKLLHERYNIGMLVESDNIILGYMIYSLLHQKLSITRLIVRSDMRRRGIGTMMINKLKYNVSNNKKRYSIDCNVPAYALDMQLFLRDNDFLCNEINYYDDNEYLYFVWKEGWDLIEEMMGSRFCE